MFDRILCANDGSERAFRALTLAVAMAKESGAELHMVSVEEIDYMPEFIEEIREQTGTAARRFHRAQQRARMLAEENHVVLRMHLMTGHAVRDIVRLATEIKADLLVIGQPAIRSFTSACSAAAPTGWSILRPARCWS
jgi:nucleotide-binding universal stress UspA family protein